MKLLLFLRDCLQAMSAYGYEIVQTLIVDIEPDEHVKRAMNEINAGILHHQFDLVLICFRFPGCVDCCFFYLPSQCLC